MVVRITPLLRPLALAALAAAAACDERPSIEAEPTPRQGASVEVASGVLEVPITFTCGSVETQEVFAIPLSGELQHAEPEPIDCEGEIQAVRGAVQAKFDDAASTTATATAFSRALHVVGTAHASCVGTPTASHLALRWASTLALPEGNHRVQVSALSNTDRSMGCEVRLAGELADPIRLERSRLALAFATGPAELELVVDCPGFSASACFSNPVEPPTTSEMLDIFIEVAPTE